MSSTTRFGIGAALLVLVPAESACNAIISIAGDVDAGASGGQTSTGGTGATDGQGGSQGVGGAPVGGPVGLPCDVLGSAGNICVAAHSTVRLLLSNYTGPLYQVQRLNDGTVKDIPSVDGYADSATQEAFCAGTSCTVSIIYDQSAHQNDLRVAPPGGNKTTPGNPANASALKLTVNGHSVYGLQIKPGMGYRQLIGSSIPTGDAAETIYMVTSKNNLINGCCFDYGNAETDAHDDGNGTAEAVYFGTGVIWGTGSGAGPWVMADLENGLYAGWENNQDRNISTNSPLAYDFVTAVLVGDTADKNAGKGRFALYGGDATSGTLSTMYDGIRPAKPGYVPMAKQGSVVLGVAGDNSNAGAGEFFEGVIATSAATKATLDVLQANIAAAGYGRGSSTTGGQGGVGGAPSVGGAGGSSSNGGTGATTSCPSMQPCGGNVVGTWEVTSSCESVSGEADLSLLGLGCKTAPILGSYMVSGTFTANADGTYDDNTRTTGSAHLSLPGTCLSISGTTVRCEQLGPIFLALGYASGTCSQAAVGCSCVLTVDQLGSMGVVSTDPWTTGSYTTSGSWLTLDTAPVATQYLYCATDSTLSVVPQTAAPTVSGFISLQRK